MGIKGLTSFIRTRIKEKNLSEDPLAKKVALFNFRGRRLAIDANNWMFTHISTAQRRVIAQTDVVRNPVDRSEVIRIWFVYLLEHILLYIRNGITPVFVFDGEAPIEKTETKIKRSEKKQEIQLRLAELEKRLREQDILDDTTALSQEYKKLLNQVNYVKNTEVAQLRDLLTALGIPWLQARGEAERLCSMLAIDGLAAGVVSTDSDNLIYGCPCLITDIERGDIAVTTGVADILNLLDLEYSQFVDFGIMCGTDYNSNMRLIGPVKSYRLLRNYGLIEDLPEHYDTSVLNYQRGRELFRFVPPQSIIEKGTLDVNQEALRTTARPFLVALGLEGYLTELSPLYRDLPKTEDLIPRWPHGPKVDIVA